MTDPTITDRTAAMHRRLEEELDELVGTGMLVDPAALRRLRGVIDEAIPVADAYAEAVSALPQDAVA